MLPLDATAQQQVVAQAGACGVDSSQIATEVDEVGGDIYVTIKGRTLADAQISCLLTTERQSPYPVFIFADRATSRRFEDLAEAEGRKEAQNWLEQRGLLKKLPTFNPAIENVMSYSRKLEKFCGMKAGSVLTSYGPRFLTVKSHWTKAHLSKPSSPGDEAKFMCLMNALRASDLEAHGVHFGFVGSEASPAIETR